MFVSLWCLQLHIFSSIWTSTNVSFFLLSTKDVFNNSLWIAKLPYWRHLNLLKLSRSWEFPLKQQSILSWASKKAQPMDLGFMVCSRDSTKITQSLWLQIKKNSFQLNLSSTCLHTGRYYSIFPHADAHKVGTPQTAKYPISTPIFSPYVNTACPKIVKHACKCSKGIMSA